MVKNKHYVIFGSDGRFERREWERKNDERVLERVVIIGPYEAQIREASHGMRLSVTAGCRNSGASRNPQF